MRSDKAMLTAALSAVGVVVLVIVVIIGVRAGGGEDEDTSDHPSPAPTSAPRADPSDEADAVAEQALRTIFTWQPAHEDSPGVALERAAPWLTGPLAAAAAQGESDDAVGPPQWDAWAKSGDVVTAAATTVRRDSTDARESVRTVDIARTIQHGTGDVTPMKDMRVLARLERQGNDSALKLAEYRVLAGTQAGGRPWR